jgi:hypothetical protein
MEVFMKSTLLAFLFLFLIIGCGRSSNIETNTSMATSNLSSKRSFEEFMECSSKVVGEMIPMEVGSAFYLHNYRNCFDQNCRINEIGNLIARVLLMSNSADGEDEVARYESCSNISCQISIMSDMAIFVYSKDFISVKTSKALYALKNCTTTVCMYEKLGDLIAYSYLSKTYNTPEGKLVSDYFSCK